MKKINYENPVFYDLETSGLNHYKNEVIQLAAYAPFTGKQLDIKIQFDMSKANDKALEINKYSEERWQDAVSPLEALKSFQSFLEIHADLARTSKAGNEYRVGVLVGHNIVKMDDRFLDSMLYQNQDNGRKIFVSRDPRTYDTLQLAQWILPNRESYKLGELAEHYGIDSAGAHDALADVIMNAKVCAHLLKDMGQMPEWAKRLIDDQIEDNMKTAEVGSSTVSEPTQAELITAETTAEDIDNLPF